MDTLTKAFIAFGVIDLCLVGTTCILVMLLVIKVMRGKVEIKIGKETKRLDRPFVEIGSDSQVGAIGSNQNKQ